MPLLWRKTITLAVTVQEEDVSLLATLGERSYKEFTEQDTKAYRTLGWKLARAVLYAYENRVTASKKEGIDEQAG